jgi:hypothetical protein
VSCVRVVDGGRGEGEGGFEGVVWGVEGGEEVGYGV